MKTILTPLLILIVFFFCKTSLAQTGDGCAAFFESIADGDWDDPAIWFDNGGETSCDGIPDGDDVVQISHNVSLTQNQYFQTLGIINTASFGAIGLTIPAGDTLTGETVVDGSIICQGSGVFMFGQINCYGVLEGSNMAINSSGSGGRATVQVIDGGHISLAGGMTFSAAVNANFSQFVAKNTTGAQNQLEITGLIEGSGTFDAGKVTEP
ncbi:MAG: hypothetical protein HOK65_11930, partial [Crocinitomicaceae bacterium]|nr:hypothetical protein [Crocinitomicaceae bacterium]